MKALLLSVLVALSCAAETRAAGNPDQAGRPGAAPATVEHRSNDAVFDRHKGAIYALYARALRDQPRLSGKIVFDIDIDAAGVATGCRVKSSQLRAPDFERKLCERIKLIRFAPQTPTTYTKDVTLLSAA